MVTAEFSKFAGVFQQKIPVFQIAGECITLKASSFILIDTRWWGRRMDTHLLLWELQNYNSLLNNHQQENVWSNQKKNSPLQRAKEKPQQDGRRGKIMFSIKPHTCQRCLKGSNKTLCTPRPRDTTETDPDLCLSLLWRYGSAVAYHRGRGSGCNIPGYDISPLGERRSPLTPPQSRWADDL